MTPDERSVLQYAGVHIFGFLFLYTSIALFYGFTLVTFTLSTYSLLCRGLRSTPHRWMLAATSAAFLVTTMRWALALAGFSSVIVETLIRQSNSDTPAHGTAKIAALFTTLYPFLPVISDTVVVWRCWILFSENRYVMLLPLALLLGTIAAGAVSITLAWKHPDKHMALGLIPILALVTNAVATSLIFYKLWDHRKTIRAFTLLHNVSRARRVMVLLLESGVMYCFVQLGTLIACEFVASPPRSAKDYELNIFSEVSLSLTAMYPSIVVVLVNRQRSIVDTFGLSAEIQNVALEDGNVNMSARRVESNLLNDA